MSKKNLNPTSCSKLLVPNMDLGLSESSLFDDFRFPELFESDFSFCSDNEENQTKKEISMAEQSLEEEEGGVREREKETNLLEE